MNLLKLSITLLLVSCFNQKSSTTEQSQPESNKFMRPSQTMVPTIATLPKAPKEFYKSMSGTIRRIFVDNDDNTDGTPYTLIQNQGEVYNIEMKDEFDYLETGDEVKVSYIFTKSQNPPDNIKTMKVIKLTLLDRSQPDSTSTTKAFPSTTWPKEKGPFKMVGGFNLEKKKIKMLGVIISTNISGNEHPKRTEQFLELLKIFQEKLPTATFNRYEASEVKVSNVRITDDTEDSHSTHREAKAHELLKKQNIDVLDYDHIVYLGRTFRGLNWGTVGSVDKPGRSISIASIGDYINSNLPSSKIRVLFHEWGHNIGMLHSNTWGPTLTSYFQDKREYFDNSSVMGNYHCLKLNFLSFNSANVATHFLGDDHESVKEVTDSGKHLLQIINTVEQYSPLRVLKFQETLTNKEDQQVINPFYVSLVRQCSLTGRGAHNVLIHQKSGKETYIVGELKPGESVKILNHEVVFEGLSDDFIATISVKN